MSFKDLSDKEKLQYLEERMKKVTIDLFTKKITANEFEEKFNLYCNAVSHLRKTLNMPDLFDELNEKYKDTNDDPDTLYQINPNLNDMK